MPIPILQRAAFLFREELRERQKTTCLFEGYVTNIFIITLYYHFNIVIIFFSFEESKGC